MDGSRQPGGLAASYRPLERTTDGFSREVEKVVPSLRLYALKLTHNSVAAEDLVQDTFVLGSIKSTCGNREQTCEHGYSRFCTIFT